MANVYQIRVKGHLDPQWADWFDGLTLTHRADGTTLLSGPVADQAALHGKGGKIDLSVAVSIGVMFFQS